jgi:uncharacterized protein
MKIWIDADAAPRDMKEIVFRAARRLQIPTVLVANRRLHLPPGNPFLRMVTVSGGPDEADRHIVENASPGDLAITADLPLSALLVEADVLVLDPRGELISRENIGERLAVRDFMDGLRGAGIETGGARPYGQGDRQSFAAALDRVLAKIARSG